MTSREHALGTGLDVRVTAADGTHVIRVRRAVPPRSDSKLTTAIRQASNGANTADTAQGAAGTVTASALGILWGACRALGWLSYRLRGAASYEVMHSAPAGRGRWAISEHQDQASAIAAAVALASAIEASAT